jgi:hypothetical protein
MENIFNIYCDIFEFCMRFRPTFVFSLLKGTVSPEMCVSQALKLIENDLTKRRELVSDFSVPLL